MIVRLHSISSFPFLICSIPNDINVFGWPTSIRFHSLLMFLLVYHEIWSTKSLVQHLFFMISLCVPCIQSQCLSVHYYIGSDWNQPFLTPSATIDDFFLPLSIIDIIQYQCFLDSPLLYIQDGFSHLVYTAT